MNEQELNAYILTNQKYFPSDKILYLKQKLEGIDSNKKNLIYSIELKDPIVLLLFSLFLGSLGIDRFMLGQTGMGVGKLLTLGGCGIWALIDLFLIMDATKQFNYNKIMLIL